MEYSNPIHRRPDLDKLRKGRNISKIEDKVAKELRKRDFEVTQQLIIPKHPQPYRADLFLPEKDLIVEIDGGRWHQDETKRIARDQYIVEMGANIGVNIHLLHILYQVPPELLYWEYRGKRKEEKRQEYKKYIDEWLLNTVVTVIMY
jgi:hypothetical protein